MNEGASKKLSFIIVDEEADKRIEDYFASKPIKTRTIFENHRIKKGIIKHREVIDKCGDS